MRDYTPINSELFDRLRATATLDRESSLTYLDENNEKKKIEGHIIDVYTKDDAEWCKLKDGTIIRLDRIEKLETDS